MITSLLTIYSIGILTSSDLPPATSHNMPWSEITSPSLSAIPEKNDLAIAPILKAKSALSVDLENGLTLYEKDIHTERPIASLTKLMTAIIILEENDLKDIVTVSKNASQTEGSKIWLAPDEKITVENLLYAVLIHSANDAAVTLAEYNSENTEKFIEKMNKKAIDLGMYSTHFQNPTGLDVDTPPLPPEKKEEKTANNDTPETTSIRKLARTMSSLLFKPEKQSTPPTDNYSTAYDLSLLARYAYGKSFIRRAAIKQKYEITSVNEIQKHKLTNTNSLLDSYLKVLGLKTGTTDEAGECLISIIETDQGHRILNIVLNSPARFTETKVLTDWITRNYTWK